MAYIIPAYKVFDDIENRFGVPPRLPSETASETATDSRQNYIIRSSEPTHNCTTGPQSSTAASNFDDLVCKVRLPWTDSKWPLMYGPRHEYNGARPRVKFIRPWIEVEECPRIHLEMLAMKKFGDFSNRTANVEPSSSAFGQRTRCYRSVTSGSQLPAVHTREGCSKQVQTLQESYSRAPLVIERRRTRILAQALDTGGEPLRDSLLLSSADYKDSYYEALSYGWGEAVNGTLSKDTENLDFALYPIQELTTLWVDSVCNNQRDWRETNASATRMKALLGEGAACSYAIMASVYSVQKTIPADTTELEPQDTTMRYNHPVRRLPLRLSSLPSSDSVSLDQSTRAFEFNFPDCLRTLCARLDLPRYIACLESSDVESTRFRARVKKAARLAYLAACLTEFSGDLISRYDENVLISRFDALLSTRRLSEIRAACGDSLGQFQQHGATLGDKYYRRLPLASMGESNLHVLSDHLLATFSRRLGILLQNRRDATTCSASPQFSLCDLVAILWHDENSSVGYYNAVAHFKGTLQSSRDETIGRPADKSLLSLMIELHGFSVDAFDEWQTPDPHRQIWVKLYLHWQVFGGNTNDVLSRSPERLRFFWWANDPTLRQASHAFGSFLANVIRSFEIERHEQESLRFMTDDRFFDLIFGLYFFCIASRH